MVEAGLVAADAGVDLVGAVLTRLAHKGGVGQQGPGHRHHVAIAPGQQALGHLGRIDAVGGDQGDGDLALEAFRHPGESGARHAGGDGRDAGFVPADAGVEDGGARRLDGLGQLHHFVGGRAALDQVQHRQAVDDDEVGADFLARATHDLERQADAVLVGSAPFVVALIGAGGDELVDQIALGAHDLDAVIAGGLGQGGAAHKVCDGLLDLLTGQGVGGEGGDRGLDGRGCYQVGVVGVAAEMKDLQGDLAALGVDGGGDEAVMFSLLLGVQLGAPGHGAAAFVGRDAAGDDQPDLAARPLGVEGGHALETVLDLLQPDVHRPHQHPVLQRGEAEVQRLEQFGIGHERGLLCNQLHN
ncbi:hypothetical protein D3C87_1156730 [compost metagenome]